jgi:hypothetical protein
VKHLKNIKVFVPVVVVFLGVLIAFFVLKNEEVEETTYVTGVPEFTTEEAPKDLKAEVDRLAELILTSYDKAVAEKVASDRLIGKLGVDLLQLENEINSCYRNLNYKSWSGNYRRESKCSFLEDRYFSMESQKMDRVIGRFEEPKSSFRKVWARAWLDLTTLAKTFPQFFNPTELPGLLNYFERAKICVGEKSCYPKKL